MKIIVLLILLISCTFNFSLLAQGNYNRDSNLMDKKNGLIFANNSENRIEGSTYTNTIQLLNLKGKTQAIQFKILFNKSSDDSTILIFKDVQKGTDLSDPGWLLDFNVVKGPVNSEAASKDEIFVLLYNANQDGGLIPGSYQSLIEVKYSVANISQTKNEIKSSIKIANAEASTFDGNAITITPDNDELKIFVKNR